MKNHQGRRILNLEITGVLLAVCAGLLGLGLERLGFPFQAYLPVIFGLLITASAALLKFELMERIDRDSRIQSLLNQLEHEDLHKRGVEIVDECEEVLEDLSRGIIKAGSAEIFKIVAEHTDRTRKHIQATHLAPNLSYIYNWEDNQGLANYYQSNLHALKRNVTIERLFLLKKEDLIDKSTGQVISSRALRIMQDQQTHGIKVFVTWLESVADPEPVEDFIIFDNEEVAVQFPLTDGKYHRMLNLYGPVSVRTYKQRFVALKTLGQSLNAMLEQGMSTPSPNA